MLELVAVAGRGLLSRRLAGIPRTALARRWHVPRWDAHLFGIRDHDGLRGNAGADGGGATSQQAGQAEGS